MVHCDVMFLSVPDLVSRIQILDDDQPILVPKFYREKVKLLIL